MNENNEPQTQQQEQNPHPDEVGGFYVESHIKIFDPTTDEVFVDKRDQ